jgi:hypothetical protein
LEDKEQIYDEKISPLMTKIINICDKNKIPFFAEFQYSNDGFCKTRISKNETIFKVYDAISQSKQDGSFNIDKFLFWVVKTFDTSGSIFLNSYNQEAPKESAENACHNTQQSEGQNA